MSEIFVGSNIGQIHIANEVLAVISGTAAGEVEGVIAGVSAASLSPKAARRNFAKGVKITMVDGKVKVDITIVVKYGSKLHDTAVQVQNRIIAALETMVGMTVGEVNVTVASLRFDKPNQPQKRR